MKLEKAIERSAVSTGEAEEMEFTLDQESMGLIFKGFSDGLYSNKIGSIVRELTSNCFDSHAEAGIDDPIRIKMVDRSMDTSAFISFIDYGVGMSPDRVKNVYRKYFASTKRETNDQIGGFGLGSKSPLSYCDHFSVITRFDGIEYIYAIYRGENSPVVKKMTEYPTDQRNGTEVKILIEEGDERTFKNEVDQQLKYFEGIIYEGCGNNHFKIYRGKHYLYRNDNSTSNTHICYGKVAYPLDNTAMGWGYSSDNISCPIALRFEIGELSVTMNRESIEYTPKAKEAIEAKLELAKKEMLDLFRNTVKSIDDLFDYHKQLSKVDEFMIDKDVSIKNVARFIGDFEMKKMIKLKGFENHDIMNARPYDFYSMYPVSSSNKRLRVVGTQRWMYDNTWENGVPIYRISGKLDAKKTEYLLGKHKVDKLYILVGRDYDTKDALRAMHPGLPYDPNGDKTKAIQSMAFFKYVDKYLENKYLSYDDLVIPEEWLEERRLRLKATKNVYTPSILRGLMPFKALRGNMQNAAEYYSDTMKIGDVVNGTGTIVYGFAEDSDNLKRIFPIFRGRMEYDARFSYYDKGKLNHKAILFCKISKSNEKYVKERGKRAIHISEFMDSKHPQITRYFTARFIKKHLDNGMLSKFKDNEFSKGINRHIGKKMSHMHKYINESNRHVANTDYELMKQIDAFCLKNDLLDKDIINDVREAKEYMDGLCLLEFVDIPKHNADRKIKAYSCIRDYMKMKGKALTFNYLQYEYDKENESKRDQK